MGNKLTGFHLPSTHKKISETKKLRSAVAFLFKARAKFGQRYDYGKVEYEKSNISIIIVCPVHGEFKQTPVQHIRSVTGCTLCGLENIQIYTPKSQVYDDEKSQKLCSSCQNWKPTTEYHSYVRKSGKDVGKLVISSDCKTCARERYKHQQEKKKQKPGYSDWKAKIDREYRQRHDVKKKIYIRSVLGKSTDIKYIVCDCGIIEVCKTSINRGKCKKCHANELSRKHAEKKHNPHKKCKGCGIEMYVEYGKPKIKCDECKAKAQQRNKVKSKKVETDRARAKKYGVYYEPVNRRKIYERDKFMCQECGKKVIKPTGKNKPNEWTLGHKVPMSKGGSNSYANCQCECRECNTRKSNMALGQQMTIFEMMGFEHRPGAL